MKHPLLWDWYASVFFFDLYLVKVVVQDLEHVIVEDKFHNREV